MKRIECLWVKQQIPRPLIRLEYRADKGYRMLLHVQLNTMTTAHTLKQRQLPPQTIVSTP